MNDRRTYMANHRVVHESLPEYPDGVQVTDGVLRSIAQPVTDLLSAPDGNLDRQLLFGDVFLELDVDPKTGFSFGQALDGKYVGYVDSKALGDAFWQTHLVTTFGAHVYEAPDLKSGMLHPLPFLSVLSVGEEENGFGRLEEGGYVPLQQVAPKSWNEPDYMATALRFLDVPYLWGGDSNWGLDCSGLVHAALRAAQIDCPRDSDQQEAYLGEPVENHHALKRGDLVFWKGHVGLMCDAETIVHANGHHMAVTRESFNDVCERIEKQYFGAVTSIKRIDSP